MVMHSICIMDMNRHTRKGQNYNQPEDNFSLNCICRGHPASNVNKKNHGRSPGSQVIIICLYLPESLQWLE